VKSPHAPDNPPSNGNAIDWESALDEHRSWIRTVVRSRIRDSHAADDVVQEIALAVLQQNSRPTDSVKVAPWLYRIAVRQTINYRRRTGRQDRLLAQFASAKTRPDSPAANPHDWVLAEEQQLSVAAALECLSAQAREILLLKYAEGWTYKQLASHLGVKMKTVEHRLMKARDALRCRLREQGIEEK